MNELMNKVMQFRSEVDHVWKMPNTLGCLRYAAKSANGLRHLWMRQQDSNCDQHSDMTQELANTVIVLLMAVSPNTITLPLIGKNLDSDYDLYDFLCIKCELSVWRSKQAISNETMSALSCCQKIANTLGVTLDDIVKARLKDIAQRNGFDESLVDNIWLKAEMLKVSDDHKPHRHYDD